MPIQRFASTAAAILALLTGAVGFLLGTVRQPPPPHSLPSELLTAPRSFSEVENARTVLEGLARQFLYDWGSAWVACLQQEPNECRPEHRERLICDLRLGMEEFEGTSQEFIVAERYLMVCAQQKKFDWWVDAYLKMLYRHPSHRLVMASAQAAVPIARQAGREADLQLAFVHLLGIPPALGPARETVQLAAISLGEHSASPRLWVSAACPYDEIGL